MAKPVTVPFFRTPYNYDMNQAGNESALHCKDPTLTKQAFAEEVDINTIVRRFNLTGELPQAVRMPTHGDFTEVTDFQTAMNAIARANEAFDAMPAHVRAEFNNDPARFVEFCSDEKNRKKAEEMGLVPPSVFEDDRKRTANATDNQPKGGGSDKPQEPPTTQPDQSSDKKNKK